MISKISQKLVNYFITSSLIGIIVISIISPLVIEYKKNNWENDSKQLIFNIRENIQDAFDLKANCLIGSTEKIIDEIKKENNFDAKNIYRILLKYKSDNSIQLYDNSGKLIAWNNKGLFDTLDSKVLFHNEQTFFLNFKAKTYLNYLKKIELHKNVFWIINSELINNEIKLNNYEQYFVDSLKINLNKEIDFIFDEYADLQKDGRKYSFHIINNFKNKIAVCSITYPSLNFEIDRLNKHSKLLQSILLIILAISIIILIYIKCNKNHCKIFVVFWGSVIIRYLLYLLEIPSSYIKNEFTNPANYSSRFAFGLVSSPLELLITIIFIMIILTYVSNKLEFKENIHNNKENKFLKIFTSIFNIFLILIIWRGFGASIRSVIFDSNIRYFNEFNLLPQPAIFLMCINILLIGLIFIHLTLLILNYIFHTNILSKKYNLKIIFIFFLIIQFCGFLFDSFQKQPQGTSLIRILFISSVFVLLVIKNRLNLSKNIQLFFVFILSSILSVSLLTYYNSEHERESLKNYAIDYLRIREPQVQFMIYQSFANFDDYINDSTLNDFSLISYKIWHSSLLKAEGIRTEILFFDVNKNYLGGFSNYFDENPNKFIYDLYKTFTITKTKTIYNDDYYLYGVKYYDDKKVYLVISTNFINHFPNKNIINAFDYVGKLNINKGITKAFIVNNEGISGFDEVINIDEKSLSEIKKSLQEKDFEKWINTKINDENYLTYCIYDESVNPSMICLSKPVKSISWNLSDFFKIFLIHSYAITVLFAIKLLIGLKRENKFYYSFRFKLGVVFVLISVVPLVFISAYVRNVIEENNNKIIKETLKEKALQISNLVNENQNSEMQNKPNYKEISEQTGLKYSVYKGNKISYSSFQTFYDVGFINKIIDANAYNDLYFKNHEITFIKENILNEVLISVYLKKNNLVIALNEYSLSKNNILSKFDFDIFIFGVFSFILILVVSISSILSYQISKPIKQLSTFTEAVANGDLNINVNIRSKDEFSILSNAFNSMIKKIKDNQIEIARFEREAAWKEMAKQVAHEIKNPLTPMKLLLQQLIASYNQKSEKFDEVFNKATTTILNQIELLKNIASEFSNFARLPNLNIEKIELNNVIKEIISLFNYENKTLTYKSKRDNIIIKADKDNLKRTFINLIRNAFQANATKVEIVVDIINNSISIKVIDDGNGIDPQNIDKIFMLNFSTKEKGMGIGLSMAKQYLESIGGSIYVGSTNHGGTTFIINIPMVEDE